MSAVIYHPVDRRLSKVMSKPGGLTVSDAVAAAEAGLALLRDRCAETVRERLAVVETCYAALPASPSCEDLAPLYRASQAVIGMATPAGMPHLDRAAYCFCELLDLMIDGGRSDRASIAVCVEAFRLLPKLPVEAGGPVVDGLEQVVAKWCGPAGG